MGGRNRPRAEIYLEDRKKGLTYREIAEKHGVSFQAVQQCIGQYDPAFFKQVTEKQCIYPKLRKWMNDNEVSRAEILRRMGRVPHGKTSQTLAVYLRGKSYPTKQYIDELLQVTGLTYEELFWRGAE